MRDWHDCCGSHRGDDRGSGAGRWRDAEETKRWSRCQIAVSRELPAEKGDLNVRGQPER
jgi:hypothetical protein